MQKIELDGRIYYYNGKYFCDENFFVLEGAILGAVSREYYKSVQVDTLSNDDFMEYVVNLKKCGLVYEARKMIEKGFVERGKDGSLLFKLLPVYTSCCREMNQPQRAIACAEKLLPICGGSSATYTSLAAAYCDVGDYENAKRCAGIAYAKQGGGQGYTTEVSLVFKRIQKETGEKSEDFDED